MLNDALTMLGGGTSGGMRCAMATAIAAALALSAACHATIKDVPTSPASSTVTSSSAQDRATLSGRLLVVVGDPPPDSGLPSRRSYTLIDQQGQQWTLVFDDSVYPAPGGILNFNGKQVAVEGRQIGPNRLLVESIRLL